MTTAPTGGAHPCVRISKQDGEEIALVRMHDGRETIFSCPTWEDRLRAGYPLRLHTKPDGKGREYPAATAYYPSSTVPRATRDLAREVQALKMLRVERAGGPRAPDKGWVTRTLNGNPFDLRDGNLEAVPARGQRNGFGAVWDARERLALADLGLNPNQVFAERRKAHRVAMRDQNISGVDRQRQVPSSTRPASPLGDPGRIVIPPSNEGPSR
jgi:hypothetical protein